MSSTPLRGVAIALMLLVTRPAPAQEAEVLDRAAFQHQVLAGHPSLSAAEAAVRAAGSRAVAAGAWADPMVEVETAPASWASADLSPHWALRYAQDLPSGGRRRAALSAADARTGEVGAEAEATRQALARAALQTWDAWYLVHRALEQNQAQEAIVADMEAVARAEVRAGRAGPRAPLAAAAERVELAAERAMLEAERAALAARINALLHRAADLPVRPPPAGLALPDAAAEPPAVDQPMQEALAAAQAMAAADEAMARAERRPMVALMAGYEASDQGHASGALATAANVMVGVGLSLPIWQRTGRAAVDAALADQARLDHARAALDDEIAAELAMARAELQAAATLLALQRDQALPIARERFAAARAGFVGGTDDIDAVLDAADALAGAELALDRARVRWLGARADLELALGHAPSPSLSLSAPVTP